MKHTITQKDAMGCGAACVAFATNKPYTDIVAQLGKTKAETVGFRLKELVDILNKYGLRYKSTHIHRVAKKSIYHDGVIVFIKKSKHYPYGHYLIRHGGRWADPWINLVADRDIINAKSGYRRKLTGEVQWIIYPTSLLQYTKS